jgi:hypothetical protein
VRRDSVPLRADELVLAVLELHDGQQLHIAEPDPNRQAFRERVGAELIGELAGKRGRLLSLLVIPESPERRRVRLAHLDPGAVAEVPVLVGDDRQLEQRAHEIAVAALPVQHREVVFDVGATQALLFVEQEDGLRQAHADVARLARVRLATDVTGESHYAAVAVPGRYCCQTCGIVGVARWMNRTGAGARGGRFRWSPDSSSRRSPLRRLHGAQAVTTFSQIDSPPRERGTTWSSVSRPLVAPQ